MDKYPDSLEEHLEQSFNFLVQSGYRSRATASEQLAEILEGELPDASPEETKTWFDRLDKEFNERERIEETWTASTTNDRITAAFQELAKEGIIALECAGFTMSDGWEDVADARKLQPEAWAAAFFHEQDVARALNGSELLIAFGAFTKGDDHEVESLRAGKRIVDVLWANNVTTSWPNTLEQRIAIQPFEWQRRTVSMPPNPVRAGSPQATSSARQGNSGGLGERIAKRFRRSAG